MGEATNPTSQFCMFCAYAAKSASEWPCRCCTHINQLEDYFSPFSDDEEIPSNGDEIRSLGDVGLAEFIIDRLHISCGNCPAEPFCMQKGCQVTTPPGSDGCKHLFASWLAHKKTGKENGA